jgi:CheY-like chemotaxis protein
MKEERRTILVVDDDKDLRERLQDVIGGEGWDVVTAANGEQALRRLRQVEPELILLDMNMPGMGGLGFLKRISDEAGRPRYPVIVLTSRGAMREFFETLGVTGFIEKPCPDDELLGQISRAVGVERQSRCVVLVGDDDNARAQDLKRRLDNLGFAVRTAPSMATLIEQATLSAPDVILMRDHFAGVSDVMALPMVREASGARGKPVLVYGERFRADGEYARRFIFSPGIRSFLAVNQGPRMLDAVEASLA